MEKVFSKAQVLAERNGWSIARAQGFVDGEMSRRRSAPPSAYARVGIDDYSLGFRAGYYERGNSQPTGVATTPGGLTSTQPPPHQVAHLDHGHRDGESDKTSTQLA
jgi:hypothetical protein